MTPVYIIGSDKALSVVTWIKENIKECVYTLDTDPVAAFNNQYKFLFESKHDATMVALRWGNHYGRLSSSTGASQA